MTDHHGIGLLHLSATKVLADGHDFVALLERAHASGFQGDIRTAWDALSLLPPHERDRVIAYFQSLGGNPDAARRAA